MKTLGLVVLACAMSTFPSAMLAQDTKNSDRHSGVEDTVPDGLCAEDWAGIREAYEAGRHAAYSVENGYQAHNPGQAWLTHFDSRGFTTRPDAGQLGTGGWTWGLELEGYGFAGIEQSVTKPAHVTAEGGRVTYEWDANLEEWYVNDRRSLRLREERDELEPTGLSQGFQYGAG